jgi:hypothetical protein
MRRVLAVGVLLAIGLGVAADDEKKKEPAASELLAAGVAKAKKQDKPVFLLFGSPG